MSETVEDITFDHLEKEFHILNNLPLSSLYSIISIYDVYEQKYDAYCHLYLNPSGSDSCDIRRLCLRAYEILSMIKQMIDSHILDNKIKYLEHLFYWIYDHKRKNNPCDDANKLYTQLNRGEKGNFEEDNSYINDFNISEPDFIKKKALFLHDEILYWIVHATDSDDHNDSELYNKYLDKCADTYKNIICNDDMAENATYWNEAEQVKNNFDEEKLWNNKLKCQKELQDIQERGGRQVAKEDERQEEKESKEEAQQEGKGDSGLEALGSLLTQSRAGQVPGSDGQMLSRVVRTDYMDPGVSDIPSNSNVTNFAGTYIYTSLGLFLPLVTLYKFTPLGSWINTKILRKNNLMDNMKKNEQELLLNSSENREINFGNNMYHIKYNSVTN
ncbi:Plasmodium vivax Vir protein, putative [Plasmodium vivax]|nr:Plasmodium vivax Vir protein, putative [Plasmodium vivax]